MRETGGKKRYLHFKDDLEAAETLDLFPNPSRDFVCGEDNTEGLWAGKCMAYLAQGPYRKEEDPVKCILMLSFLACYFHLDSRTQAARSLLSRKA